MYAVLKEFIPTADAHGEEEGGLAVWGGEMETDAIKVDKLDIEGGWSEKKGKNKERSEKQTGELQKDESTLWPFL